MLQNEYIYNPQQDGTLKMVPFQISFSHTFSVYILNWNGSYLKQWFTINISLEYVWNIKDFMLIAKDFN